jgi:hypothetical protein
LRRVVVILALAACKPQFDQAPSQVHESRILAVRGTPAEARPGTTIAYDALIVAPDGSTPNSGADWAYCNVPKPLDENNTVASGCTSSSDSIVELGMGPTAMGDLPLEACSLFGPDPPPQMTGQPPLRPRDPDVTGGYYQPIRLQTDALLGFGLERITCSLAQAGADISVQFGQQYKPNENPTLWPLTSTTPIDSIKAGSTVTLTAWWPPESVESFPVYDPTTLMLVQHKETMRVSWFASDGSFVHDHTGIDETETDNFTSNDWTAPSTAETVHLWLVLRDSRGGVDFTSYDLTVTP